MTINIADLDSIKSTNGLYSYQKDLVKFTIFIKHQNISECRRYLARVLANILLG
jgi:site-specific recombinase XerD